MRAPSLRLSNVRWLAALLLALAGIARAQPEAVVLVARPDLLDPNFGGTVVLVTHTPGGDTLGVVLNRPTRLKLTDVAPEFPHAAGYRERLFDGGPVMRRVIVALFRAAAPPAATAFRVLPDAYLSIHPGNITALLERPQAGMRLFAGFCGWAPGQLEAEIESDSWYVLPASEDLLFRKDTSGLWQELVDRASGRRTIYFPR